MTDAIDLGALEQHALEQNALEQDALEQNALEQNGSQANTIELAAPEIEFFHYLREAPMPRPIMDMVPGFLPHRAHQYCPPVSQASSYGWAIFPPLDFALRWDGKETHLAFLVDNEPEYWHSLSGAREVWIPEEYRDYGDLTEKRRAQLDEITGPGGILLANCDPKAQENVELMFGVIARTSPGWASLVRSTPNLPTQGYQVLEGLLETSWYQSWVPVIIRLTDRDRVVRFYRDLPAATLSLVPEIAYAPSTIRKAKVIGGGIAAMPDDVWADHVDIKGARHRHAAPGNYKTRQARNRKGQAETQVDVSDITVTAGVIDSDD